MLCEWKDVAVLELNIREDHIHTVVDIPPRSSIAEIMGTIKGKTAIKLFKSNPGMKKKPYWGNHFWSRGYCVSTIGLDEEKIRKYVKYQEDKEKKEEFDARQYGLF
jgi:putative transposase